MIHVDVLTHIQGCKNGTPKVLIGSSIFATHDQIWGSFEAQKAPVKAKNVNHKHQLVTFSVIVVLSNFTNSLQLKHIIFME